MVATPGKFLASSVTALGARARTAASTPRAQPTRIEPPASSTAATTGATGNGDPCREPAKATTPERGSIYAAPSKTADDKRGAARRNTPATVEPCEMNDERTPTRTTQARAPEDRTTERTRNQNDPRHARKNARTGATASASGQITTKPDTARLRTTQATRGQPAMGERAAGEVQPASDPGMNMTELYSTITMIGKCKARTIKA